MITIVGSAALWPIPSVASAILIIMLDHPGNVFCVRANRNGELASGTEDLVSKIGARIGETVLPWPSANGSSFSRDNQMVTRSTHVYAFFAPGQLMEGGTGHVAAVALRADIPLIAYTIDADANVYVVAEYEREDLLQMAVT